MAKVGKKYEAAKKQIEARPYTVEDAMGVLKKVHFAKFNETIEVHMRLGVDPKHADQMVRGTVVLPHGLGKSKTVCVIASGDKIKEAEQAGAEFVGGDDMVEKIAGGWTDFDAVVATPDMMRAVGKLGKVLGPRGLMPNPKLGTVTPNVAQAVKDAKGGQVQFRADKAGIVQCTIGRASFTPEQLRDNLAALVDALNKAKPAATKGIFLKKLSVSSTMGVGVKVDPASLSAQQ